MKTITVSSGQSSAGIMLSAGDAEYVLAGGTATGTVVHVGGTDIAYAGGLLVSTHLMGGTEVLSGGVASGTSIGAGGVQEVLAQGSAMATSVGSGGTEYVAGGISRDITIGGGGTVLVDAAGTTRAADVQSGGMLVVLPGASAGNVQVEAGGRLVSGGVVVVSGYHVLSAAGTLSGGTLAAGRTGYVLSGGSALGMTVTGGSELVFGGGVASGTQLRLGQEFVQSGGLESGGLVRGGSIGLESGGVAAAVDLVSGGLMYVDAGGFARDTMIGTGGSAFVFSGGASLRTSVGGGGRQFVQADGIARDTVVGSGGIEVVGLMGSSEVADVRSGGEEYVSGGHADGTIVEAGGVLLVAAGQEVTGADVQSGGTVVVLPGAAASATVTEPGGALLSGGVFVLSGARLVSATGSLLAGVNVASGVVEFVLEGGTARGGTISGTQYVYSGGVAKAADIALGGTELVYSGGLTSGAAIGAGGTLVVAFGGLASGVSIGAGGNAEVLDGLAVGTVIGNGGVQMVEGGTGDGSLIGAGGLEVLFGTGSGATVMSGGEQFVAHGVDTGTDVAGGGVLVVSAGGTAQAAQVESGGTLIVLAGGEAHRTAVASGGTVQSTGVVVLSGYHVAATAAGTLSGFVVSAIDSEDVLARGVALGGFVDGTQLVASGGLARGETVFGNAFLLSGGTARGVTVSGGGLFVSAGAIASGTTLSGGTLQVSAGGLATGSVVGNGGSLAVLTGGSASGTTIAAGGTETMALGAVETGVHLLSGGTLVLQGFGFVGTGTADLDRGSDRLTVSAGGTEQVLQLSGNYDGEYFHVTGGAGASVNVDGTPCFCRGTRVLTEDGEVAVEDLGIGDRLVTLSGGMRTLRWIGRRGYGGAFAARNPDVLPVVFAAGSLGGGLPLRALWVSPLHGMYLDGVLVPAGCLIDGGAIRQAGAVDEVAYFHLELDRHDIILAEGAACESYLEDDNRGMFHNAAEFAGLYPSDAPDRRPCAPRVEHGPALETVRRRLAGRAVPAASPLRGWVDVVTHGRVAGWACDDTAAPVRVRVLADGVTLGEAIASLPRADVAPGARCGFDLAVPEGLASDRAHVIEVRRAGDGALLGDGPRRLAAHDPDALPAPRGRLDRVDRDEVLGWLAAGADGAGAVQVIDNGALAGRTVANRHRADVAMAGEGQCAFVFRFAAPLSGAVRHVIEVRRECDGAVLPGSPLVIEPTDAYDGALEASVGRALEALDGDGRLRALDFLLAQAERLRQRHADAEGERHARTVWHEARRAGAEAAPPGSRVLVIAAALETATLRLLDRLRGEGHAVSLVMAGMMDAAPRPVGVSVCAAPMYRTVGEVLQRQAGCFDRVWVQDAALAGAVMDDLQRWMPGAQVAIAACGAVA